MTYLPRIVDAELDDLMEGLPAIALEGPKGVGKTATAHRRAATLLHLDDPAQRVLLQADASRLDAGEGTVLIDEWQRYPPVWDMIRRRVDAGAPPGRYLLTGSAVPVELPAHSGAGRIVTVRLRPLSLAERNLPSARIDSPRISMAALLAGTAGPIEGEAALPLADYVEEILASGFPGIRQAPPRSRRALLDSYLQRIVQRDFAERGLVLRRPATLSSWLRAYAAATATTASYNTVLKAAAPSEEQQPAKTTTIAYRDVLSQLWLLEPLPGWLPTRNRLQALTAAPKHHLADPALAARLLRVDADTLLTGGLVEPRVPRDGPLLGALFESLVTLSVRVYAQAAEATVSHMRTHGGDREVDLIVEGPGGRVLALEVKLGGVVEDRDVAHLLWLRAQIGDNLADAAVITTGAHAYRRPDGIAVIPAALLGP